MLVLTATFACTRMNTKYILQWRHSRVIILLQKHANGDNDSVQIHAIKEIAYTTSKLFRWVFNYDAVELWKHSLRLCVDIALYRPCAYNTVKAGKIGRLEQFDSAVESWDSYQERLEQYFICKHVANEKKVPKFLTSIGGSTYSLLRGLTRLKKPFEVSYRNLEMTPQKHLCPKPLILLNVFVLAKENMQRARPFLIT